MITGITIENFKGIREPVHLDLRPITLLFGANSAGKSTILHALHYAREVFERHNLDADQTIAGGKYIDLGGFQHFMNGQDKALAMDPQKQLRIRVDLNVSSKDLPSFDPDLSVLSTLEFVFDSIIKSISTASVEVAIGWSTMESCPYVTSTTVFFDDIEFATIAATPNLRGVAVRFTRVIIDPIDATKKTEVSTLDHPSLTRAAEAWSDDDPSTCPYGEQSLTQLGLSRCQHLLSATSGQIDLSGKGDALPPLDRPLECDFEPFSSIEDNETAYDSFQRKNLAQQLVLALSELILGPCQLVRDGLREFRYLGPLRDTPARVYDPPRFPDPSRWSSGLGARDSLYKGKDELVNAVGQWLGDESHLNSGCTLERRFYLELDAADPVVRKLINRQAFDGVDDDDQVDFSQVPMKSHIVIVPMNSDMELRPHDVGIGISQGVPVIVTALDGEKRLLAIEQPELHIHPRLQAAIADLFIEAIHKQQHCFIIETHSEHLIL